MKIGINAQLLKRENSGVGIYISNLVRNLLKIDSSNEYFIYIQKQVAFKNTANSKIRTTRFPTHFRPVRIFWEHNILHHSLVVDGINVFHSTGYILPPSISIPSVVSIHDIIALLYPSLCKKSNALYYGLFLSRSAKKAQRIIAHSQKTKEDIINHLHISEDKIAIIYPGVDERFKILDNMLLRDEIRKKYALPEKFILFVGNLEPKKNIVRLIDAFFKLKKEKNITHSLVIVGKKGWGYENIFSKVKESPYGKDVLFIGYVHNKILPVIYNMAELFVFPSLYEGFGIPPLEAMACGVPVITSNRGSLPEVVKDAAIIVSSDNTDELADAMFQTLTDANLRKNLIAKGIKRSKLFSWDKTAKETLKVYEQVYNESITI